MVSVSCLCVSGSTNQHERGTSCRFNSLTSALLPVCSSIVDPSTHTLIYSTASHRIFIYRRPTYHRAMLRSLSRRMTGRKTRAAESPEDERPMAYATGPSSPGGVNDQVVPPIPSSPSHLFADSFPTSPSHKALKAAVAAASAEPETHVVDTDVVRRSSSRRKKAGAAVAVDSQPQPEMMMGLGEMIKSLDIRNLAPGESARFGEVMEAGGYTWLEGDRAAIAVPGERRGGQRSVGSRGLKVRQ